MANKQLISIIVSMGKNREIGKGNDLLWNIPEDRKRFKEITMGHVVIWGRKTFESVITYIHKAPPGRTNIIITRDKNYKFEDCIISHSFKEALKIAEKIEIEKTLLRQGSEGQGEIFIGGGGQIYKQAMEAGVVDKLYLTIVEGEYESDTFFPDYSEFRITSEGEHDNGEYKFKFVDLEAN